MALCDVFTGALPLGKGSAMREQCLASIVLCRQLSRLYKLENHDGKLLMGAISAR
jgi:hypothetical protein